MRKLIGGIVTCLLGAFLAVIPNSPAYADTVTTVGYYSDTLTWKTASATFESWIIQERNNNGVVVGAIGRTRITGHAGVKSMSINAQALRWANNDVTIMRDGTLWWQASPGTEDVIMHDTNDSLSSQHFWASTVGQGGAGILRNDVSFSIHWGDDTVITYNLGSLSSVWYTCLDGTLGQCGYSDLPISI